MTSDDRPATYHRAPDPGEQPIDQQQHDALAAARASGYDAKPPDARDEAARAVVRAVTRPGPAPHLHRAQVDRLAAEWPTLAAAVAALLHAHGAEVPPRWCSMDVSRWSR